MRIDTMETKSLI